MMAVSGVTAKRVPRRRMQRTTCDIASHQHSRDTVVNLRLREIFTTFKQIQHEWPDRHATDNTLRFTAILVSSYCNWHMYQKSDENNSVFISNHHPNPSTCRKTPFFPPCMAATEFLTFLLSSNEPQTATPISPSASLCRLRSRPETSQRLLTTGIVS